MKIKWILVVVPMLLFVSTGFISPNEKPTIKEEKMEGIQFSTVSFKEALTLAKQENKLVFLDAYTTWCGPCKMLEKTTFRAKEVGKVFNENFINIRIDMEKGEGPQIAKKYKIYAYPTLLLIKPNGKIVKRMLGYVSAKQLIQNITEFIE